MSIPFVLRSRMVAVITLCVVALASVSAQQPAGPPAAAAPQGATTPQAAAPQAAVPQTAAPQGATTQQQPVYERVSLTAGRSLVLTTDFDIVRIAVTNPAVADAVVVAPREILIDGKAPGTISLIVWGGAARKQYDLVVEPGVRRSSSSSRTLFPGRRHSRRRERGRLMLSGNVSSNARDAAGRPRLRPPARRSAKSSTCSRCPAAARASR